jgi:hypothetical protein
MPVIGFLSSGSPSAFTDLLIAFRPNEKPTPLGVEGGLACRPARAWGTVPTAFCVVL